MERFISDNPVAYIIPFLAVIAVLLYRLNENSSTPKKNYRKVEAEYINCLNCNARVELDATSCPVCDDEPWIGITHKILKKNNLFASSEEFAVDKSLLPGS